MTAGYLAARFWQQHDHAVTGTAHSEATAVEQNEKGAEMDEGTHDHQQPIMFVFDEAAGVFDPPPAVGSRGAAELIDDLLHELRTLPRSTRRLPLSALWRASAPMTR